MGILTGCEMKDVQPPVCLDNNYIILFKNYSARNLYIVSIWRWKNLKIKIYGTLILPVVFYGCETWSLTLGEEHWLRVFENRVLRIFGPRRDEVTEVEKTTQWGVYDQYSSPSIIQVIKSRRMRWAECVVHMGERERYIQGLGGETWVKETT